MYNYIVNEDENNVLLNKTYKMKKLLTITLTLMMSLSLLQTSAQEEMQYLFGGADNDVSISGFATVINSEIKDSIISQKAVVEDCFLELSLIGEGTAIKEKKGSLNVARTE